MATKDLDWTGLDDASPCSDPRADPKNPRDYSGGDIDWRGMGDATPASSPTTKPDKQD